MNQPEHTGIEVRIRKPALGYLEGQARFQALDIPPRSRLYGLEPCGMETVWSESLTSYLNRLGWRHGVSPRALAAQFLGPFLANVEWWRYSSPKLMSVFCTANAMSLNGSGNLATTWATLLGRLTERSDLHLLTAPWWIGDLPNARNLRLSPAWCPACYAAWKEQELPIYQPLLWMLQVVTICPNHKRRLVERCPYCQGKQAAVASHKAHPGECTKCARWLGTKENLSLEQRLDDELINSQEWIVSVLKELRAESLSSGALSWKAFFTSLARGMEQQKGYSQLARLTGIDRPSLYEWVGGTVTPSLELILKFCFACGTTPMQIMANPFAPLEQALRVYSAPRSSPHHRSPRQRFDRERCLNFLQAILDGREEVLSVRQASIRLKCRAHALRLHFPSECEQITQQYNVYRRQQREKYLEGVRDEVRNTTMALHIQGISPTRRSVAAFLKDPDWMRMPEARKTWKAVRQELALMPAESGS